MRLIRLGSVAVLALCAVTIGVDASARGRASNVPSYPVTTMSRTAPPGFDVFDPVCRLGHFGTPPASGSTQPALTFDPNEGDYFYTWLKLDSLSCNNACGIGSYGHITAAHVALFFPAAPETLVMSVRVVGVVPIQCRYQDPPIVFCPAFDETLTWQDPISANDFAIPIPGDCRINVSPDGTGQAFLEYVFKYSSLNTPETRPQVVVQTAGLLCETYIPFLGDDPKRDWVVEWAAGNPIMYVDVEQCLQVPTRRVTWGQLKQLYR